MDKDTDSGIDPNETVKIKIEKGNGKSDSSINGSVNGQSFAVAVGQEVEVPAAVAEAIASSGVAFEVIDGAGAGLPASSVAPLTDTATREAPAQDPLTKDENGDPKPVPTLLGGDGDTGIGSGTAEATSTSRDLDEGMANDEGQGVAGAGGERVGNDPSAGKGGENADKAGGQEGEKPETVAALKERIATISDVAELRKLHEGETRTTALAAIDARIDDLTQNG